MSQSVSVFGVNSFYKHSFLCRVDVFGQTVGQGLEYTLISIPGLILVPAINEVLSYPHWILNKNM